MIFPNTTTNIPESLLQAQEDGRLVFFCGAGISYDAKIPLFRGLMERTARLLNLELHPIEKRLLEEGKLDQLYLRYERVVGDATLVRTATARILQPKVDKNESALLKHISLLKLAKNRNGKTRIVTTNYDCLFDRALRSLEEKANSFAAPLLPIPDRDRWNGIVYLHGKLDKRTSEENLNSLVLSSGDFGRAYLTERWASRFVTELFRNYEVCFVGYSVNDLIIKYMMDAFTSDPERADRPIYAFAGCKIEEEVPCIEGWNEMGIEPIPYRVTENGSYEELTNVLRAWAEYQEIGRMDKASVVRAAFMGKPDSVSEIGKNQIDRVRWALHDMIGVNALPNARDVKVGIGWLEYLTDDLLEGKEGEGIVEWILSLTEYPQSLCWCVAHQNVLLRKFAPIILKHKIGEAIGDLADLWRMYLIGLEREVRSSYFWWFDARKASGELTPGLRQEFKRMAQPMLRLIINKRDSLLAGDDIHAYFDFNIHIDDSFASFDAKSNFKYLTELIAELTESLVDACAVACKFESNDYSCFHIVSLFNENDGRPYNKTEWYYLIILLKYAFLGLKDETCRQRVLSNWMEIPYEAFYRLVLWGYANVKNKDSECLVQWLIENPTALWSRSCSRELFELLISMKDLFSDVSSDRFQTVLLDRNGMKQTEIECATRLEYLQKAGVVLAGNSLGLIEKVKKERPGWYTRNRNHDGVCIIDGDVDELNILKFDVHSKDFVVPKDLHKAEEFFKDLFARRDEQGDPKLSTWITKNPSSALELSFRMGIERAYWPVRLWDALMRVLMYGPSAKDTFASLTMERVAAIPISLISDIRINLGFWMREIAKAGLISPAFIELNRRILFELEMEDVVRGTKNAEAPFELAIEALIRSWFNTQPQLGKLISEPYRALFTKVSMGGTLGLLCARDQLFNQIANFFAIDPEWTKKNLVPYLSWSKNPNGALRAWNEAILSNRYEPALLILVWKDFLQAVKNFEILQEHSQTSMADLIVYHLIHAPQYARRKGMMRLLRDIPDKGRISIVRNMYERLCQNPDKADIVWLKEIVPILKHTWPGEGKYRTKEIFTWLSRMVLLLDAEFENAVNLLSRFVSCGDVKVGEMYILCSGMRNKSSHCDKHPWASLKLLSYMTNFSNPEKHDLKDCLKRIEAATNSSKNILSSKEFKRLNEIANSNTW